jgi:hypothetical protein
VAVGFTTTYSISAYRNWSCEFESDSWRSVLNTTLCDKVCQWIATDRRFSLGTPVSSANKTARHDITEILLKVALTTINQTRFKNYSWEYQPCYLSQIILVLYLLGWLLFNAKLTFFSYIMARTSYIFFIMLVHRNKCW